MSDPSNEGLRRESPVTAPTPARRSILIGLPLALFLVLALVFYVGLYGDPKSIPSTMIGKPVPAFTLRPLEGSDVPGFSAANLKGQGVRVVNIFASWCVPCRAEHPLLLELAKRSNLKLYGINNKDTAEDARAYLNNLGQPYSAIGSDHDGRVSIDWGVYGVPESFIVDADGLIRYKFTGPLTPADLNNFEAEIEKAKRPLRAAN